MKYLIMVNVNNLLFMMFILVLNGIRTVESKLLLTIYYENNCPDSRYFVLRQLLPAMQQLHEHVRMRFVPFGKAMSIDYGFGGFECQHGVQECFGNMVQDCTLEIMDKHGASDLDKLHYVACELDTYAGSHGNYQCATEAQVQPEKVQHCIDSGRGTMLQLDSEYHTSLVAPKFVPTVTFNKVFDQQIQDSGMENLLATICTNYLQNTPPCSQFFNHLAWRTFMYRRPSD